MPKPTTNRADRWLENLPEDAKVNLEDKLENLLEQRKYGQSGFGQKPGPILIKRLLCKLKNEEFGVEPEPVKKPIQRHKRDSTKRLQKKLFKGLKFTRYDPR